MSHSVSKRDRSLFRAKASARTDERRLCQTGKFCYRGRREAKRVAALMAAKFGEVFNPYRCRHGAHWHVGRPRKERAA